MASTTASPAKANSKAQKRKNKKNNKKQTNKNANDGSEEMIAGPEYKPDGFNSDNKEDLKPKVSVEETKSGSETFEDAPEKVELLADKENELDTPAPIAAPAPTVEGGVSVVDHAGTESAKKVLPDTVDTEEQAEKVDSKLKKMLEEGEIQAVDGDASLPEYGMASGPPSNNATPPTSPPAASTPANATAEKDTIPSPPEKAFVQKPAVHTASASNLQHDEISPTTTTKPPADESKGYRVPSSSALNSSTSPYPRSSEAEAEDVDAISALQSAPGLSQLPATTAQTPYDELTAPLNRSSPSLNLSYGRPYRVLENGGKGEAATCMEYLNMRDLEAQNAKREMKDVERMRYTPGTGAASNPTDQSRGSGGDGMTTVDLDENDREDAQSRMSVKAWIQWATCRGVHMKGINSSWVIFIGAGCILFVIVFVAVWFITKHTRTAI